MCCRDVPEDLDAVLKNSPNIWFSGNTNLEVTILVDPEASRYSLRRTTFPTQEIREQRPDDFLVVSFRMGQYEAIRGMLKS